MAADDPSTLPAIFPAWVDRLQIKYFNPVVKPLSKFLPGTSLITHRGRKSGKTFQTVVTSYRKDNTLAIALGHGKTDWVKNVMAAGEADIRLFRTELHLVNPRILPAGSGDTSLPFLLRVQNRKVAVLVTDIA
ncbi:nitroreductase family deazaflavin-dependent oxidoreductase [Mycolicibacter arupensis]|jgi:deazaflavin-dependent oxidoreductase (nitroreductase family)|uniref:Nitroreductase n=1 Tax=Mycolicibacter arupensis TaxID=342002 RepID=A0A0F5N100_9MYCO|nr:nitroreductase family deazaflavin-dependent oxidoreductase [Mycolicibacter arupensis]KAA1432229.1 nitroreductase family deazaflavin-dependent oxidoreductase [Mycolicibacter arupensis]KKC00714.1 nitroreductase [Mycolicibacter arupensis]MCV7275315.1 nitroreductase family deazaflavin-dependent oxidoreductase [Mycolicibacter arupensis]ORA00432.1 nitroreductase [Mycolicibacter arupensis]TXI56939.1 MAG: nitroreductase family deazaflavin-dependent oxidoreductase [Mycolicibacter arupensis]